MSNFISEQFPDDPDQLPAARRRRSRRLITPLGIDERSAFLDRLANRASPSFDFFLFSFLSGLLIGLGLVVNSSAIVVLGCIIAPLLAPMFGLSLAITVGSLRLFIQNCGGILVAAILAFLGGAISGLLIWLIHPLGLSPNFSESLLQSHFNLATLFVLIISSGLLALIFSHPEKDARLISVALAYSLYPPLSASGLGLVAAIPHAFPDGIFVFVVYLSVSIIIGVLILGILGFRPPTPFGYTLGGTVALLLVVVLIGISGTGTAITRHLGLPTPIPSLTPTPTLTI
ncbi:MAG: DUF389 domain-containing protein, partial [Anaerolineales bacterium]